MDNATWINDAIATFRKQKALAEKAMAQLSDEQLHAEAMPGMNAVAVVVKHLAGNMRSRWTDWLTTDGEKPGRDRDQEFEDTFATREEMMRAWEAGWSCVFDALAALSTIDLAALPDKPVRIRGVPCTIPLAILRQIDHYGYHIGQIVTFSRALAGDRWQTLSIAKGKSRQFNQAMGYGDET